MEKVYPSAKPPPPSSSPPPQEQATATPAPAPAPAPAIDHRNNHFPLPKTRPYAAARPPYLPLRPPIPEKRRPRRHGCCCCFFLLLCLLLVIALILSVIAGSLFYVLYQPHRPSFSISGFRISRFNFTSASDNLDFTANFSIAIHNNNKRMEFIYDRMPVLMKYEDSGIGRGDLPPLIQPRKNTTILSALISPSGRDLDSSLTDSLRSKLGKKEIITVIVQIDTGVRVRVSGLKTKRIKIRVSCGGIRVPTSGGRAISYSNVKCKAGVRIKIWKWTITK